MEAKLILIDANSKGAEFLVKKRERDGAYTMIPRGRDRGFGSAHTDSVDLYIGKRFVNFSGDAWRFFEGTLDTEKFLAALFAYGPDFIEKFCERFEKTSDDNLSLSVWENLVEEHKEALADEHYEAYLFGDGVTVQESDNWDTNDEEDFTKIVYVSFDDQSEDAPSHRLSFHVRFDKNGRVDDVYALDLDGSGGDVGVRGLLNPEAIEL